MMTDSSSTASTEALESSSRTGHGRLMVVGLPLLLVVLLAVVGAILWNRMVPSAPKEGAASPVVEGPAALPPTPSREPRSFHASPDGQPTNDGSQEHPLDLASALSSQGPVAPGDTLWLRDGVYQGHFRSDLSGRSALPIYIKQYPGERAVLDGASSLQTTLEIVGGDVWFWGFTVTNSSQQRVFDATRRGVARRATGITVDAPRVRLINLTVHDAFTGVVVTEKAEGTELYGCVVYDNGIRDAQGGLGHGLSLMTGTLQAIDVVSFGNQGRGINAGPYSGPTATLLFDGLVSFDNGQSSLTNPGFRLENLSVDVDLTQLQLVNSHLYHPLDTVGQNVSLSAGKSTAATLTATRNAFVGGSVAVSLSQWRNARMTENLFYIQGSSNPNVDQRLATLKQPADVTAAYDWNRNRYVDDNTEGYPFIFNEVLNGYGGANLSFVEWQKATKFDAQGQYQRERPSGTQVFVRANRYDSSRALAVVYNWGNQPTVEIPLHTLGFKPDERVEVVDIQRMFDSPIVAERYAGRSVGVPMTPSSRVGAHDHPFSRDRHTLPRFGVFLIRKAAAGKPTTTP
jgi:hypothetical protein